MPILRLAGNPRRRPRSVVTALGGVTVLSLAMIGGPTVTAAGESTSGSGTVSNPEVMPRSDGPGDAGGTYRVTLVTGDVVVYSVSPDGNRSAQLADAPTDAPPATSATERQARVFEENGHVHLVPAEAEPYLAAGMIDPRLFDITLLVEQGHHDEAASELPLIMTAPDGAATLSASALPAGTSHERDLASIDAVSLVAGKDSLTETWDALRGDEPATLGTADAAFADVGSVWLNGTVEATLDESVAQVGAHDAWDAGLDASGVSVAILDSGYDPAHPDLADRVIAAVDFTTSEPGNHGDPGAVAVDTNGHGTHVAATIAGSGAASDGSYAGVAPGADLMIGRVLDAGGAGTEAQIIAGMQWAVDEGADIVNMSLSSAFPTDGTDPMSMAVNELSASSDALFVVAAGNSGPRGYQVGSPGAATHALTVGAVTKDDVMADYSSRGPRLGDDAIKPEIVAPGSDIVAARAAGTSLGNLRDENYTALNGTSMATPHVAGAAAILAQQHPDWTGEQLKARLISTALPLDDASMAEQGAGRLDVAAAISDTVTVSAGALSIGEAGDDGDPQTLTFTNPQDRHVMLRLDGELQAAGEDTPGRPVLDFDPTILSIPAGGEATAGVTVRTTADPGLGTYTGSILGLDPRHRDNPTRVAVSFALPRETHTLTVSGTDRNGEPATTITDVWDEATGDRQRFFGHDGESVEAEIPEGTYTILTEIVTTDGTGEPTGSTIAGEPEVAIDGDLSLAYDAQEAEPLTVETERPTDLSAYNVYWARDVGHREYSQHVTTGLTGEELSVIPGPEADDGTFTLATNWQLVEPLLTAALTGPAGFDLTGPFWRSNHTSPYVGEGTFPIVDAGTGTPEEYASAGVADSVAVVTRDDDVGLSDQVLAAEEAGAEFVLAANDRPGLWREHVIDTDFPVYLVNQDTGEQLRQALAQDPSAMLDVTAIRDHSYTYQLAFSDPSIPSGQVYDTEELEMATVESDYREPSDRIERHESWGAVVEPSSTVMNYLTLTRQGPVERTEYVNTEDVTWSRHAQPHPFRNVYWTSTPQETYEAGETYERTWWGPLVHPGTPTIPGLEDVGLPAARFHDAIRIYLRHYLYDESLTGTIFENMGDTSELTLRRDGETVGTAPWPEAQFTVPPEEADYELALEVDNSAEHFSDTSVRTETTWGFRSGRPDSERAVLPLIEVDYTLDTGAYNEMPTGSSYPLVIDPGYQPGAAGPEGFDATVEVSYDDGETWEKAQVEDSSGRFTAVVPATEDAGFATVRIDVTDSDGNRLRQQIDRAWKMAASSR